MIGKKHEKPEKPIKAIDPGGQNIFLKGINIPYKIYPHKNVVGGEVKITARPKGVSYKVTKRSGTVPITNPIFTLRVEKGGRFFDCTNCGKDLALVTIDYKPDPVTESRFEDNPTIQMPTHFVDNKDIPSLDLHRVINLVENIVLLYSIGEISKKIVSKVESKVKERKDSDDVLRQATIEEYGND